MFAYGIFKIIYSPFKAFKEIIQNPKYSGPLLIMLLFIVASTGRQYARASKMYVQQTSPSSLDPSNLDPWTEDCAMWMSNGNVTCNNYDGVFGANSIQFNVSNGIKIWMKLTNITQINCLGADGYKNLTFGMKWIHPMADQPQNANLYLYSLGEQDYFYRDLAEFVDKTEDGAWSNYTVPVGPNTEQWVSSSAQTTWNNITGLELELMWAESARSNLTVLLDKLFFQSERFEPLINFMGSNVALSALDAVIGFSFYWMLSGLSIFIAARIFKIKAEFKIFLIIVGYALIAMVFMEVAFSLFYLSISPLYFSLEAITPNSVFQTVLQFGFYTTLLLPVWSIILSSIGVSIKFNLPLGKGTVIATIGFLPYYILYFIA